MLNLLAKDFKLQFLNGSSTAKRIIQAIIMALIYALLAALVTFIFNQVLDKVIIYDRAPNAYLALFLAIISVIMIVLDLVRAYKLFFNKSDTDILTKLPVTNIEIVSSKIIVMFVLHYITSLIFVYPIFISYALNIGRAPMFYFVALFYPALSFIFEAGVALIFVYPFKLVVDYLKKHLLIQFIISVLLMTSFTFLYARILNLFMDLVVNNNLTLLFTTESIENMLNFTDKLYPLISLVKFYLGIPRDILTYLVISLGIFVIGFSFSIFAFSFFRNIVFQSRRKKTRTKLHVYKANTVLIKKELTLLFKESGNIFSFSALLIVEPFLMYLIISSLNGVFTSGIFQYSTLILPGFTVFFDIVLVMLISTIITSGASQFITNEKKTVRLLKTLPIKPLKQIWIKILVPYVLSLISLIISTIVLFVTKVFDLKTWLITLLLSVLLLTAYMIVSAIEELKMKNNFKKKTVLSTIYMYVVPILFFGVSVLLSLKNMEPVIVYLAATVLILGSGIPFLINILVKTNDYFLDLEIVN